MTIDSTSSQSSITQILSQIEDPDNPRRGEKRFLDFELSHNQKKENLSSDRLQFFKRESFGCCRKVMRVMLYDIIIAIMLLIIGIAGIITTEQIRDEIYKYFNDTTCDEYIITNTTEHADTVFYISLGMILWSILIILILFIFWKWTWNKLIEASHEPQKYLQYRTSIKMSSKIIFWINLLIFFIINLFLFWSGTRFWRDVEDADNEQCIIDSTLDNLSDQLKYTLMPSFITACIGGSSIIFAYFICVFCPYGINCCGHLIFVKDEKKYHEWKRLQDLKHKDENKCEWSGSCSMGTCSGGSCS